MYPVFEYVFLSKKRYKKILLCNCLYVIKDTEKIYVLGIANTTPLHITLN